MESPRVTSEASSAPLVDIDIDIVRIAGDWPVDETIDGLARRVMTIAVEVADIDLREDAEICLVLSNDDHVRELNRDFRGKDKPTDVLSFPAAEGFETGDPLLGELVFAAETVARDAAADDKPLFDHFTHLVLHGFLHLFGYDHESEEDAEEMERLEADVLARLGIADPYRDRPLAEDA
ncbi:MAG: rRNA maturation RNase YbeY [Hyphomicrobiales bacterium]